ncbi:MAG TPA: TadE/TadG family type IV pilus assembly protein, partial [Candidatus Limnocylindria bacterium]|nr:TadE/TadG family type IV pilus assembly protein [Candidatus Limnocylindria bacterium]
MTRGTDGSTPRGQSLVEFALVLPMLLVLLLGIADFGR